MKLQNEDFLSLAIQITLFHNFDLKVMIITEDGAFLQSWKKGKNLVAENKKSVYFLYTNMHSISRGFLDFLKLGI